LIYLLAGSFVVVSKAMAVDAVNLASDVAYFRWEFSLIAPFIRYGNISWTIVAIGPIAFACR
jgi:hypothetical protein